jgi:hypothetical protein
MNAGGVPNTCKSNGVLAIVLSGERVSNALVTYPEAGDNSSKGLLIPHEVLLVRGGETKGKAFERTPHFGRGLRPIS